MYKILYRVRKRIASWVEPPRALTSRHTHHAYPESQVEEDGSWCVRFYAYEGTGSVLDETRGKAANRDAGRREAAKVVRSKVENFVREQS